MKTTLLVSALILCGLVNAQSQENQTISVETAKPIAPKTASIIMLDRKEVKPGKKKVAPKVEPIEAPRKEATKQNEPKLNQK